MTNSDDVLSFWFGLKPEQWFRSDPALDHQIAQRFGATLEALSRGVPDDWRKAARDVLAAVIVLDQFPRNMYRGTPKAFATDAAALRLARSAIDTGLDQQLTTAEQQFVYMPFQHAEDLAAQEQSVALFERTGDADGVKYAIAHRDIIKRFGRFPHRNAILGRTSTAEEIEFLKQPGSSF